MDHPRTPNRECRVCGAKYYVAPRRAERGQGKTCSLKCRSLDGEWKKKISDYRNGPSYHWNGRHHTKDTKLKMRESVLGEKNHNYIDGIARLGMQIRRLPHMKEWRSAVFKEDNYSCAICGKHGGYLQAHHWTHLSDLLRHHNISSPEQAEKCDKLWDVENGITLCKLCHKTVHGWKDGDLIPFEGKA